MFNYLHTTQSNRLALDAVVLVWMPLPIRQRNVSLRKMYPYSGNSADYASNPLYGFRVKQLKTE